MKYLSWIIFFPLALALIVFGVSNRDSVTVNLWPSSYVLEVPLYVLLLGALLTGVLWGGVATWMSAGRVRREARRANRDLRSANFENRHQKKEIEALKAEIKSRDAQDEQITKDKDGDALLKIESSAQ